MSQIGERESLFYINVSGCNIPTELSVVHLREKTLKADLQQIAGSVHFKCKTAGNVGAPVSSEFISWWSC